MMLDLSRIPVVPLLPLAVLLAVLLHSEPGGPEHKDCAT